MEEKNNWVCFQALIYTPENNWKLGKDGQFAEADVELTAGKITWYQFPDDECTYEALENDGKEALFAVPAICGFQRSWFEWNDIKKCIWKSANSFYFWV